MNETDLCWCAEITFRVALDLPVDASSSQRMAALEGVMDQLDGPVMEGNGCTGTTVLLDADGHEVRS